MYHASFQYHQGITSDCGGSTDFSICYKFLNVMVFFSPVLGEMIKSSRTSFARASSIFLSRFSAMTMSFVAFYTVKWCSHVYTLLYYIHTPLTSTCSTFLANCCEIISSRSSRAASPLSLWSCTFSFFSCSNTSLKWA